MNDNLIYDLYSYAFKHDLPLIVDAADEIKRLRAQRDEARWEVCGFHHLTGFLAGDYAISRGWNCFKDKRKWSEFPPSVKEFDEFLKAQSQLNIETIDRLTKERDEARRMWCESEPVGNCLSVDDMYRRARVESARRGWDCYKEEADYNNEYFRTHHK
jgi:hypothetical protein